jgi:hypothetical protein
LSICAVGGWNVSTTPETGKGSAGKLRFRRNAIGWLLAVPNGLMAVASTLFFLAQLKLGFVAWLMINSCAPSSGLFVGGFLSRSLVVMAASAVLMLRYGLNGLLAYGWEPHLITAQIAHVFMVLAGIYVLVTAARANAWGQFGKGIVLGGAILAVYTIAQGMWMGANQELMERYLSGELMQPSR